MDFNTLFWHLLNFVAPAAALAWVVAWVALFLKPERPLVSALLTKFAINFVVGVVVLVGGLWVLERDGKMLTYGALVLCVATAQALQMRAWRA